MQRGEGFIAEQHGIASDATEGCLACGLASYRERQRGHGVEKVQRKVTLREGDIMEGHRGTDHGWALSPQCTGVWHRQEETAEGEADEEVRGQRGMTGNAGACMRGRKRPGTLRPALGGRNGLPGMRSPCASGVWALWSTVCG